jgi:hypothetical protein
MEEGNSPPPTIEGVKRSPSRLHPKNSSPSVTPKCHSEGSPLFTPRNSTQKEFLPLGRGGDPSQKAFGTTLRVGQKGDFCPFRLNRRCLTSFDMTERCHPEPHLRGVSSVQLRGLKSTSSNSTQKEF